MLSKCLQRKSLAVASRTLAACAAIWLVAGASQAEAQEANGAAPAAARPANPQYQSAPIPEKFKDRRAENAERAAIIQILGGNPPLSNPQARARFDEFFQQYYFRQMTQFDNESLRSLADLRTRLFKDFIYRARDEDHRILVEMTFRFMGAIVTRNFHPAVRYNAMLVIADLNQREFSGLGTDRTPPQPLPAALDFMLQELDNPNQLDAVKVAALVGIRRHVDIATAAAKASPGRSPLSQDAVSKILKSAGSLISSPAPAGRSPEGHEWMQRQAIDIVGYIGSLEPRNDLAAELDKIVLDDKASIYLRSTAAQALGRLSYQVDENFAAAPTAAALGAIVAQACKSQLDWWDQETEREKRKELEKKQGLGGDMGMGMAGMGMEYPGSDMDMGYDPMSAMGSDAMYGGLYGGAMGGPKKEEKKPEDYRLTRTRRAVKAPAWSVKQGLEGYREIPVPRGQEPPPAGLMARAPEAQQAELKKFRDAVDDVIKLLDKQADDREALLKDLRAAHNKLVALVAAANPQALDQLEEAPGAPGSPAAGDEEPGALARPAARNAAAGAARPGPAARPNGAAPATRPSGAAPAGRPATQPARSAQPAQRARS